jgi:hypothetical protein
MARPETVRFANVILGVLDKPVPAWVAGQENPFISCQFRENNLMLFACDILSARDGTMLLCENRVSVRDVLTPNP